MLAAKEKLNTGLNYIRNIILGKKKKDFEGTDIGKEPVNLTSDVMLEDGAEVSTSQVNEC